MNITLRITGITRMKDNRICMSGYSDEKGKYFRPLLRNEHLTESDLFYHRDRIKLFDSVIFQLDPTTSNVVAPHIEDQHIIEIIDYKIDRINSKEEQINYLKEIADSSINSVFGDFIDIIDGHPVVLPDCGLRSLGTIISPKCEVFLDNRGSYRVNFQDQTGHRLEYVKCVAYDSEYAKEGQYKNIPVRISLTRLWKKTNDSESYYWVQVSNIVAP